MFYRAARVICRIVLALLRRWEVRGAQNLPPSGGVIVIANHISYWDPVVVGCTFNRQIYFMAKAELFKIPLLGPVITKLGAFPIHRDGPDPSAIRHSLQLLKAGKVLGIFPEGTRSHTEELLNPHLGAAMLALKVGVPILPVAVSGTKGIFGKVRVTVGKPIEFNALYRQKPTKTDLENVSRQVMAEIDRLRRNN